ncbi:hypothetical protein DQ237_10270 [Blastococcus sp. TF02-8]|uniref:hypothetical protein n=1 Tax=Blastococcus sp. TF02-8 TaxID=2250574 RepID=UPI000DE96E2D|nr:hypothetical protein [Blastococcus sp. TF02-8]RBY96238.1 hypothetical protein DQ237_10270 [Blastococcus sp. TF02-8]
MTDQFVPVAPSEEAAPELQRQAPRGAVAGALEKVRRVRFLGFGLAGQGLSFAAMIVPIVCRQTEQVLLLVLVSAIAGLVVNAGMLAFPFVYPVVRGPRAARVATEASLGALVVVSLLLLALTPVEGALDLPRGTAAAAAALTASWGLHAVVATRLVRAGDRIGIGLSRLYYGAAVLVVAVVTSVTDLGALALSYGTAGAYLVAAGLLIPRRSHWGPPLPGFRGRARRRLLRAYLARSVHPTLASLANGWTSMLPGLVLPGLGSAAAPWAVVTRICGGFATVLIAVAAPPLEAELSRAIRTRDHVAFAAGRRRALLLGGASAVLGVGVGVLLAAYATAGAALDAWLLPVLVATVLFWGSLLAGTLVNRLPNFLGRDLSRLWWDTGRAAVLTAVFLLTDGTTRLILMGVVLTGSALVLLPMTRWQPVAR